MAEIPSEEQGFTSNNVPDLTPENGAVAPINYDDDKAAVAKNYPAELDALRDERVRAAEERARQRAEELGGEKAA